MQLTERQLVSHTFSVIKLGLSSLSLFFWVTLARPGGLPELKEFGVRHSLICWVSSTSRWLVEFDAHDFVLLVGP